MSEHLMSRRLVEYNNLIKENEDLYRQIARHFGMSECAFWLLYSLREAEVPLSQSELCYTLCQPKQTVNSAMKKLEGDGYIRLLNSRDRRRKEIHLTDKGETLARETVDQVILLENRSLQAFSEEEQALFLQLFHRYTENLKENLSERNLR